MRKPWKTGNCREYSGIFTTVNTLRYTYDGDNNLLTASDHNGAYTFTYDSLDRVKSQRDPVGTTLTFTYDNADNRTVVQDNFDGVTTSVYDAANRLTSRSVHSHAMSDNATLTFTYTARNQIATISRSDNQGAEGSTSYTYDAAERLTNIQDRETAFGGNVIINATFTYDVADRMTSDPLSALTYTYDLANELLSDGVNNYTYDKNGNRTMTGYTTGAMNEITNDGVWTYTYDSNGNVTQETKGSGEKWVYTYDNRNDLLTAVHTPGGTTVADTLATYTYDVFGQRISQNVKTGTGAAKRTNFAWDQGNCWADLSGSTLNIQRVYGDGADQPLILCTIFPIFYLTDPQGSVIATSIGDGFGGSLTSNGWVTYDGFGNLTNGSTMEDRYGYKGMWFDSTTGLYNDGARPNLNLVVGRFLSQDPDFPVSGVNSYVFVGNDTPNMADPSGEQGAPSKQELMKQKSDQLRAYREYWNENEGKWAAFEEQKQKAFNDLLTKYPLPQQVPETEFKKFLEQQAKLKAYLIPPAPDEGYDKWRKQRNAELQEQLRRNVKEWNAVEPNQWRDLYNQCPNSSQFKDTLGALVASEDRKRAMRRAGEPEWWIFLTETFIPGGTWDMAANTMPWAAVEPRSNGPNVFKPRRNGQPGYRVETPEGKGVSGSPQEGGILMGPPPPLAKPVEPPVVEPVQPQANVPPPVTSPPVKPENVPPPAKLPRIETPENTEADFYLKKADRLQREGKPREALEALNRAAELIEGDPLFVGPPSKAGGGAPPLAETATYHYTGPNAPPATSIPNSIWETVYPNGKRRIVYYDDNGQPFSRMDFGQTADHWVKVDGNWVNLKNNAHEHQTREIEGPNGTYKKRQVRLIDENGNPISEWVDERQD